MRVLGPWSSELSLSQLPANLADAAAQQVDLPLLLKPHTDDLPPVTQRYNCQLVICQPTGELSNRPAISHDQCEAATPNSLLTEQTAVRVINLAQRLIESDIFSNLCVPENNETHSAICIRITLLPKTTKRRCRPKQRSKDRSLGSVWWKRKRKKSSNNTSRML